MKYAIPFGLLFAVIGFVSFAVSKDLGGAFMLWTLGVAMSTMALVLIHAMTSEA